MTLYDCTFCFRFFKGPADPGCKPYCPSCFTAQVYPAGLSLPKEDT